jgi:glutaredoxin
MNKKMALSSLFFLVVAVFAIFVLSKNSQTSDPGIVSGDNFSKEESSDIVLFYGIGCPYCDLVEDHLEETGLNEKVDYITKEVYYNRANANELSLRAQSCGINTNSIGVPFLWDGEECYIGYPDIVEFFEEKASIKN